MKKKRPPAPKKKPSAISTFTAPTKITSAARASRARYLDLLKTTRPLEWNFLTKALDEYLYREMSRKGPGRYTRHQLYTSAFTTVLACYRLDPHRLNPYWLAWHYMMYFSAYPEQDILHIDKPPVTRAKAFLARQQ